LATTPLDTGLTIRYVYSVGEHPSEGKSLVEASLLGWLDGDGKYWLALVAAVISGLFSVLIAARSPRNVFTTILFLCMVCVAEWSAFEFLLKFTGPDEWPSNISFIGIALLIALQFHYPIAFIESRRVRTRVLVPVYILALFFAELPIIGLFDRRVDYFFDKGPYNMWLLVALGPALVASLVLMTYRYATAPPALRGVHAVFLWAGLVGIPAGILDLMRGAGLPGARIGNLGATAACCILVYGTLRNRQIFDIISRSREEARRLFAHTKHGLLTIDGTGRILDANDTVEELLGATPSTLEDIDPDLCALMERGGQRLVVRGHRVLKTTVVAGRGPQGARERSHVVMEDATHEYELLHELSHRKTLASLGEAAATLAHEIKNPLTAIGITVENLARDATTGEEGYRRIRGEVRRLDDLLTRSLALARPLAVDRHNTNVARLLRRTLELEGCAEHVALEAPANLPEVPLDPELIRQVVANLVKNAEEAGGSNISVTVSVDGDHLRIRVRNDGPAIAPDVLGRIFQPFVTTKADGNGLGLAFCRKVLLAHGGGIVARNTDDGVELEVSIPWAS
jgi:signal transduction histidine kinase